MTSVVQTEEDFDDLRYGSIDGVDVVANEYLDSSRWFEIWEIVWREGDTFYAYTYQKPATELQEDSEDDFDPRQVYEVTPKQKMVTYYERVAR